MQTVEQQPFEPGSSMWRVGRERFLLLKGAAAAILQVAHPQVARGVAAHSRFKQDAWGRLNRTLNAVYTISFGTSEEVAGMRREIARRHAPVRATGSRPYSAFDPDAQLWVLATLIDGALSMHDIMGTGLSATDKAEYFREMRRFGEVFGLPPDHGPQNMTEFTEYYAGMLNGDLLGSDEICAEVTAHVVKPLRPRWVRILYPLSVPLACEYVPPPLRQRLRLPWCPRHARQVRFIEVTSRFLLRRRLLPKTFRYCGPYRKACRREGLRPGA